MKIIALLFTLVATLSCNQTKSKTQLDQTEQEVTDSIPKSPFVSYNLPSTEVSNLFDQLIKPEMIDLFLLTSVSDEGTVMVDLQAGQGNSIALTKEAIAEIVDGKKTQDILIKIHADKDLPFVAVRYLQSLLQENGQLRIAYVNDQGRYFIDRLSPVATGKGPPPPPPPGDNLREVSTFNSEAIQILETYGIEVLENRKFKKGTFPKMKRNILEVKLDQEFLLEKLRSELTNFEKEVEPAHRIISFSFTDDVSYDHYFTALLTLQEFYFSKRDQACMAQFGVHCYEADASQQRMIRDKFPILISKAR